MSCVISSVVYTCKAFQFTLLNKQIVGAHQFIQVLERPRLKPILTVSNHASVIDDPFLFSNIVPLSILLDPKRRRFGFGAREICFTNPLTSWFFRTGGIIPIDRGKGIYQQSMDDAIALLAENHWFHVFSEGKVNQSDTLLPFRWGIARLILESPVPPLVIAFYHSGLDKVMPESRRFRIPTVGVTWNCRFGSPIDSAEWIAASKNIQTLEQKRIYITQKVFEQVDALRCESVASSQKPDTN